MLRRSQLYVPGNNEKMIKKATSLGADSVIIDLEDAVPEREKEKALVLTTRCVSEVDWGSTEVCVRVNQASSAQGHIDIERLGSFDGIDCLVLPKAEEDYSSIAERTGKKLIPLIESAAGFLKMEAVVRSKGVVAVAYGAGDLAASVNGDPRAYLDNLAIKSMIVINARAYGVDPIDNVFFDIGDAEGFARQASEARDLGFVGKQVIHPSQVTVSNRVFSPQEEELRRAERIKLAYEEAMKNGVGAIRVDNRLVDAVHYKLAKSVLARQEAIRQKRTYSPK